MKSLSLFIGLLLVGTSASAAGARYEQLTLAQAVQIALQNHRSVQVSQAALDMAEAQHRQAMAAFGPKVNFEAGFQRADQNRTFTFDGMVMTPTMDLTALLAPGAPAGTVGLPSQPLLLKLDVKLFNRDVTKAALNFTYPLYTGGKKEAVTAMAQKGVQVAREDQRRTELEVVRDVTKYYNGAQYAAQMAQLASDTVERFQALEDLTDRLYQGKSLKVKKTDYLRSKTTTAIARSMGHETQYASALTLEALANAMGLPLNRQLTLAPQVDLPAFTAGLDALIADAQAFNPDKQRLELAVQIADHQIDEAASAGLPMVALEASSYRLWNGYDGGLFNADNRSGWTIGVGLKWDVFDNGLTKAAVDAARAGKMKLEAQRVLLDNGLALQVKDDFMRIQRSRAQVGDNASAVTFAEENRKLNVRAYQEEMVETKDVIEAQMVESFVSAALYRARHELRSALADLDYQVGRALK